MSRKTSSGLRASVQSVPGPSSSRSRPVANDDMDIAQPSTSASIRHRHQHQEQQQKKQQKRHKTSNVSSSKKLKLTLAGSSSVKLTVSPQFKRRRSSHNHIRETLRAAVLEDNQDDLRRSVRELTEMRQEAEEKAEAGKIKLGVLNSRLRDKEDDIKDLKNRLKNAQTSLRTTRQDMKTRVASKTQELGELKTKLKLAQQRAEKAETERAKVESKISSAAGGQESFFQDILSNFKEMMENNFQCSICNELFVSATTISCGHTFCEECIEEWKNRAERARPNCPICRADIKSQVPGLVIDQYIEKTIENFFPADSKRQRAELINERKITRESRRERAAAREDRQPGGGIRWNVFLRTNNDRIFPQEYDSSDTEDSVWTPSQARRSAQDRGSRSPSVNQYSSPSDSSSEAEFEDDPQIPELEAEQETDFYEAEEDHDDEERGDDDDDNDIGSRVFLSDDGESDSESDTTTSSSSSDTTTSSSSDDSY